MEKANVDESVPAEPEPHENAEKCPAEGSGAPKRKRIRRMIAAIVFIAHVLGVLSSFHALMSTRTSQGSIAWIVSLNTFPVATVPAYWIFGRSKFNGYVVQRRLVEVTSSQEVEEVRNRIEPFVREGVQKGTGAYAAEALSDFRFLKGNKVDLLVNAENAYPSILEGIDSAEEYILVQYYIVQDDESGGELKDHLIAKAKEGVKVWFLYDEIGTRGLEDYWAELREAGVKVTSFHTTRGARNRFQINFRNHRKIVVVDGKQGWVGGLNIGDEHLGKNPKYGEWRDTHIKITGPSVLQLQVPFIEDWNWATDEQLELPWNPVAAEDGDATVLIVPTGPADDLETCSLMYQQAIHSAKERLWIASPYFVPDPGVLSSLYLASLRGVEVKIIIPDVGDNFLVQYSPYAFIPELLKTGIEIYRYEPGFLHEKVFLVDDAIAGVGTANFDNRSFRLNFEVTALVRDDAFIAEVEEMFEADFAVSRKMTIEGVEGKPLWHRAMARLSYLTAPIQ